MSPRINAGPSPLPGSDEYTLRLLLALAYSSINLYTDDGELQDNEEDPAIDFLRDTPKEIQNKIERRSLNMMTALNNKDADSNE